MDISHSNNLKIHEPQLSSAQNWQIVCVSSRHSTNIPCGLMCTGKTSPTVQHSFALLMEESNELLWRLSLIWPTFCTPFFSESYNQRNQISFQMCAVYSTFRHSICGQYITVQASNAVRWFPVPRFEPGCATVPIPQWNILTVSIEHAKGANNINFVKLKIIPRYI